MNLYFTKFFSLALALFFSTEADNKMSFTFEVQDEVAIIGCAKITFFLIKAADQHLIKDPALFDFPQELNGIKDKTSLYCLVFKPNSGVKSVVYETIDNKQVKTPVSIYKMPNSFQTVPLCINNDNAGRIHLLNKKGKKIAEIDLALHSKVLCNLPPYLISIKQQQIDWDRLIDNVPFSSVTKINPP